MQTFLPYPDFHESAKVLDYRRLGKQRVEAWQIILAGIDGTRWRNHPATRMWIDGGYQVALCDYALAIISEWKGRGYKDSLYQRFLDLRGKLVDQGCSSHSPPWLGDEQFHASHRSNLLRKDPSWYGKFGWSESPDLPYVWPVR